jgi:hypothetical protein
MVKRGMTGKIANSGKFSPKQRGISARILQFVLFYQRPKSTPL